MTKAVSFVKACKDFFEEGDGRPLTFEEFKSLSTEDKEA